MPVPQPRGPRRPIRVGLSNDYEIALFGLASMLAQFPSRVQVVDLTTDVGMAHDPQVVLFDTFGRVPQDDGKLVRVIAENPHAKVVVYSWEHYPEGAARSAGAVGYLPKSLGAEDLVAALEAIHEGRVPRISRSGSPVLSWPGQVAGLTEREAEVLSLIVRGLSNEEIAERSFLSINTIKTYIRKAYAKIGVNTRAQAVAWGYANGFASTDDTGV